MEKIIDEIVDPDDLKKFEQQYYEALKSDTLTDKEIFEYSWCLVRSKYKEDTKKGVWLLNELYDKHDNVARRDYLFYLAIGNYKLKEYKEADACVKGILGAEPTNRQASELQKLIKTKLRQDAIQGAAIVGGIAAVGGIALAGLTTLGILLSKK